jgi:low affinity Fe/Cu permease
MRCPPGSDRLPGSHTASLLAPAGSRVRGPGSQPAVAGADGARGEGRAEIPRNVRPTTFDRFAEAMSRFVSKGAFFALCVVMVIVWVPTIVLFGNTETWQLVLGTVTGVLAFWLIALLQNAERRYDEALHRKIDTLAAGLADLMDHLDEADPERLRRHVGELRAAIGFEQETGQVPHSRRGR